MDMTVSVQCFPERRCIELGDRRFDLSTLDNLAGDLDRELISCLLEFEMGACVDPGDLEHLSMPAFLKMLLLSTLLPSMSDRAACRLASTNPNCRRFVGLSRGHFVDAKAFARMKRKLRHHPAMWTFYKAIIAPAREQYAIQRTHKRVKPASTVEVAPAGM